MFIYLPSLLSTNVGFIDIFDFIHIRWSYSGPFFGLSVLLNGLLVPVLPLVRVRVYRERLSAPPGHVIGQGPAPGGRVVPRGGGGE